MPSKLKSLSASLYDWTDNSVKYLKDATEVADRIEATRDRLTLGAEAID